LADELRSDFLFARPSLIEGVARMVDLSNSLNDYNYARTGAQADAHAIYEDWKAIGHDVHVALEQLRVETQK
jgi:hypothetical protein